MKTVIYLRKSRAEELSDTMEDTLKRHKETLLDFAKNNNLTIVEIYEEVISGENLYTRIEMLRMLDDIEQGLYDAILCMDIDRLGRGAMSQQGIILETIKNANVKIITPRKIYDLNNELDEEYTEFQSFFARRELKTITRRMRQGLNKTIQEGGYIANAPYGYKKCKIGKLPSLQIVEDEAKFVKMIFDMYVNQHYGGQTIADTINSMGATPRRGAAFSRTTVMSIIKNDVYIGKVSWNKEQHKRPKSQNEKHKTIKNDKSDWIVVDGKHDAIIDEKIYYQAQEILNSRYHAPSNKNTLTNPFAGLIICSNCGEKMQYGTPKGNKYSPYILCNKKGCIKSTQVKFLEPAILDGIKDELNKLKINAGINNKNNSEIGELENAISLVEKELTQTYNQKNKLHDFLEQGVYDINTFVERNKILEQKTKQLNSTAEKLKNEISQINNLNYNNKIKQIEKVLELYYSLNNNDKNNLLKTIIKSINYYKEKDWKSNQFTLDIKLKDID